MQSALFHFDALLLVILLLICTCTYVRQTVPGMVDSRKDKNVSVLFFLSFSLLVHLTLFCLLQLLRYVLEVRAYRGATIAVR